MDSPALLRLAGFSFLVSFGTACQPIGGADPLDRGRQPLATIATVPTFNPHDEDRILQEHLLHRAHESPQGSTKGGNAGTTVTSEW